MTPDPDRDLAPRWRTGAWLAGAAFGAVPLIGFAVSTGVPTWLSTFVLLLGALAAWRPFDAILVLAGLGPLAGVVQPLAGGRYDGQILIEVSVVAVLAGAAGRAAFRRAPLFRTPLDLAAASLALIALASCAALLPTTLQLAGSASSPSAPLRLLVTRYVDRSPDLAMLWATMHIVTGAALAAFVARATGCETRVLRLAVMSVAGAAAAAALNVSRLLEIALRSGTFAEGLWQALRTFRFNTQYGDLNAAGSYFAMAAVLGMAMAGLRGHGGRWWLVPVTLIAGALWVSGSRTALTAAILCGVVTALALRRRAPLALFTWRRALAGITGILPVFLVVLFLFPTVRHATFAYSLSTRVELLKTGARMTADRPVFGVGPAQFYARFPDYASPRLEQAFLESLGRPVPRENAHNQFMQILAELGAAGLAAFLFLLVAALRPGNLVSWRIGVVGALAAFLLTSLAGHPLLIPMVAYPFWILLGLAGAGAPARPLPRFGPAGTLALMLVLAVTLPVRWATERRDVDLSAVSEGFSAWERDEEGVRFRWAEPEAAFFVPSDTGLARLSFKSPDGRGRRVDILLDGRPAAGIIVPPGRWVETNLPLPRSGTSPASRRIDLRIRAEGGEPPPDDRRSLMVGRPALVPR